MFGVDAMVRMGEIRFVALDADELSIVTQSGDAGRARTHRRVEHNVADVAVSLHDEFHQRFRLLRFVQRLCRIVVAKDRRGVAGRGHIQLARARSGVFVVRAGVVRADTAKFIGGRAHCIIGHRSQATGCKDQDIFMLAERTLVAVDVVGLRGLVPNQGVAKHVASSADKVSRERLDGMTGDDAGWLDDAAKLRPQRGHVDGPIPFQRRHVVRKVGADKIDTGVGEIAHRRKTIVVQQFAQVYSGGGNVYQCSPPVSPLMLA